jgi:hypothetical protein
MTIVRKATCSECGKEFRQRTRVHHLCSENCRRRARDCRVEFTPVATADGAALGEAAELIVAADLMRRGLCVFQNIARTGPADLVAWVPDRHEVAFIDVKGRTSAYVRKDGTISHGYGPEMRDRNRRTWIVLVDGNEITYPPMLRSLLQFDA